MSDTKFFEQEKFSYSFLKDISLEKMLDEQVYQVQIQSEQLQEQELLKIQLRKQEILNAQIQKLELLLLQFKEQEEQEEQARKLGKKIPKEEKEDDGFILPHFVNLQPNQKRHSDVKVPKRPQDGEGEESRVKPPITKRSQVQNIHEEQKRKLKERLMQRRTAWRKRVLARLGKQGAMSKSSLLRLSQVQKRVEISSLKVQKIQEMIRISEERMQKIKNNIAALIEKRQRRLAQMSRDGKYAMRPKERVNEYGVHRERNAQALKKKVPAPMLQKDGNTRTVQGVMRMKMASRGR